MICAIALDLGTTSIKAGLLDKDGVLVSIVSQPAPEIIAKDGRYESAALAYAETAEQVLGVCLSRAGGAPHLGLCSQRSSFLIWERASGLPLTPLISWQDKRGAASCEVMRDSEGLIRELTGLRLTPYYFAPKLRIVLLDHPEWRGQLERGELLVGTLDTFLIWRWTGGRHHITDVSMAARTLLMDIRELRWSVALCELFDIPLRILPEIRPSTALNLRLDNGLILQASVGDQSAALITSVGDDPEEALVNLGTGGFVVRYLPSPLSLGSERLAGGSSHRNREEGTSTQEGYLRTLIYQDSHLNTHIASEGTLNSLAAALAPYPVGECRIEELATHDIFCLAEPSGLGAPYFRNDLGIHFSRSTEHLSSRQIACLLLEGIIFRVARILEDFHYASAIKRVYLSGGLSELVCLQQGIALCVSCDVYRLRQKDSSLQGTALLAAGMTSGCYRDAKKIEPMRNDQALQDKYGRWKEWLDNLLTLT